MPAKNWHLQPRSAPRNMSDSSSAGEDDLDLVQSSPAPSSSSASIDGDPYGFFDVDIHQHSEPIDRLSTLPNPTLTHIISFLPAKDAIKTSSLSKKFQFIWTLSPTLTFCFNPRAQLDIHSFVSSVDQTLTLHNSPKVDKFQLKFDYDNLFSSSVYRWIEFALSRDVEEFDLDLLGKFYEFDDGTFFELPISLCSYSRLVKLSLSCVRFGDRKREICWNSLKVLSLGYMKLDDDLIMDILSNCRVLEDLVLRECSGFTRLDIAPESLRRLRIYGYGDFCRSRKELVISGLSLCTLEVYGSFCRKFKIVDMKSLVDCTLNFRLVNEGSTAKTDTSYEHGVDKFDDEDYGKFIVELWGQICKVKSLTFGNQFIEVLLAAGWGRMELPVLETRCLTLETSFDKCSFPVIWHMMVLSGHLEKFVINVQTSGFSQTYCKFLSDVYSSIAASFHSFRSPCLRHSLRTVEIKGFSGSQYQATFAQCVLNHGRLLEKMVVICNKTESSESNKGLEEMTLLEIVRKILSFKRASPKAVVLFSW